MLFYIYTYVDEGKDFDNMVLSFFKTNNGIVL